MNRERDIPLAWTAARLYIMVVFTSVAFLLLACKMGPDYTRPETPKADSWKVTASTAESIANLPWWELLKDQELQRLVRMAIEENLDLQIAAANIEEFRAQLMIAKFDLVPSLDYSGTAFGFRNTNSNVLHSNVFPIGPGAVPLGGKDDGLSLSHESADVGLKWEVDLWGRIRRSVEAARAQLLSKSENQRAVILGLVSNVAEAYFNLRGLDYEVEITKRTLKSWEESVRLSELRFKQGAIPKLDLIGSRRNGQGLRRSWQISSGKSSKKKTGSASCLAADRRRLRRGLRLTEQPIPPAVPPGLPSDLLQRRPDILKVEQDLAAATANIGVAQAVRFPQLALTGASRWSRASNLRVLLWTVRHLQGGSASLSGPLFNASALGYQAKATEAQAQAAVAQYRKTVLTAFMEVEDALIAVQKTGEQRIAQEQQVAALQSALTLADFRYQGGRASYLRRTDGPAQSVRIRNFRWPARGVGN